MRIQYTYRSYPNCPRATEYSKDRASAVAGLSPFVGVFTIFSIIFFLVTGFLFFGDYNWENFLLSIAWVVLNAVIIYGLSCMPTNTECELKIILLESSESVPPEIISALAKSLRENARKENLENAKDFFPRFFLGLLSAISLIAAIKAIYFLCCGKNSVVMLICALISLAIYGAIAFFSSERGRELLRNKSLFSKKPRSKPATPQENFFCRKCGSKIPSDSVYCPKCGVRVLSLPQEETSQ